MLRRLSVLSWLFFSIVYAYGQVVTECPRNIGFEDGTFSGWECSSGFVGGSAHPEADTGVVSLSSTGPAFNRHTMIKRGNEVDPFGGFSLNAPNGSDYVVRLGNSERGGLAESISYVINIPKNLKEYSIIFNYAVVLHNPTNHDPREQPRFMAKVYDMGYSNTTSCGSFSFIAPGDGQGIPGFEAVGDVLYKSWSPVLVNLNAYIGRTIRLEFTTHDCTRMGHFGYAYIDVNENCSIPITGNVICPGTTSLTLRVLSGFSQYEWFNTATQELLGTADTLLLSSLPPPGTKISVRLVPYDGLGCTQVLTTTIGGMSLSLRDPPPACTSVDLTDVYTKAGNSSDLTYTYWLDSLEKIPIPDPKRITRNGRYYIKGTSSSGCSLIRGVNIRILPVPPLVISAPKPVIYPNTIDLTQVHDRDPGLRYTYWRDSKATVALNNPSAVRFGGTYFVKSEAEGGCYTMLPVFADIIVHDVTIPNTFTPNGDGINDLLTVVVNSRYKVRSFRITNRWGETVFVTSNIENFWDGFRENNRMPQGVYYWILEGDDNAQKRFLRSGYVTIVR